MSLRGILLSTLPVLHAGAALAQGHFPMMCPDGVKLPFGAIAQLRPIDQTCGLKGKADSPANIQAQNQVKNNFCATSSPEIVTTEKLIALQTENNLLTGPGKEPGDRSHLKVLGEGKVVRLQAFLIEA